jgi:hypothetical protein
MDTLNIEWFPIEGTLIGLLRYGQHFGKIGTRYNLVDGDIDVFMRADSISDYKTKKNRISQFLVNEKRWIRCIEHHGICGKCFYKNKFETPLIWPIYVDFMGYIVEGDVVTSTGPDGYPFEVWDAKLPKEIIFPYKKCKFYDVELKCPNNFIDFIAGYSNRCYTHGSIAYPDTYNHKLYNSHWTQYLNDDEPDYPLTNPEIADLKKYAKELHDKGFASFYDTLNDPKEYEKYRALAYPTVPDAPVVSVKQKRRSRTPQNKKKKGGKRSSSKKPKRTTNTKR